MNMTKTEDIIVSFFKKKELNGKIIANIPN